MTAESRGRAGESRVDKYDEQAARLEDRIEWIEDKLENGRIRDPEYARARQGYIRLEIQAIDAWRKLQSERDLEELRQEVDELKEREKVTI